MRDETTVALNRRARHEFTIDETFEAGIVLTGTEIKSIRAGKANLSDAYARIERGEAWLVGAHIAPFEQAATATTTSPSGPASSCSTAPRSTSCSAGPRPRARRSSRSGCTSRQRAGPRSSSGWRAASSSTTAAATSPTATPGATSPASSPTPSAGDGRRVADRSRRRRSGSGRSSRPSTPTRRGEPGRVIVGGVEDVPGATMFDKMTWLAGQPRRPAPADAPRAARLSGGELQPRPAVERTRRRTPAT